MDGGSSPGQKQEPLLQQLASFPGTFWVANWMEVVERFAYYGLRTVVPIYMVLAHELGGPEFTHTQKAQVFLWWAMVQSFLPVFTGGLADRFGYKLNIAVATTVKIAGYLVMGWAIDLASMKTGLSISEHRGAAGGEWTYPFFFTGAMLLAAGTAIFKPGLQGMIGTVMPKGREAVGWAVFYQMVNVGGFIGPFLAAYMRILDWKYVFLFCTFGIALNYIPLLFLPEPKRETDAFGTSNANAGFLEKASDFLVVVGKSIAEFFRPRVFFFSITFAGFWLMFYQLFDILPNFIDDWVDSRAIVAGLESLTWEGFTPVLANGNLPPEWMINFNALLISLFAFLMGWVTGKMRSLTAMVVGIGICTVSIYALGMSLDGWWTLLAIGVFSIGEMTASPTKLRYMASIAPPGKKGLYLGYANATVGMGWSIGSVVAGHLYEDGGDKVNLARKHLVEVIGQDSTTVEALKKTDVMPRLADAIGADVETAQRLLWDTYDPGSMWLIFAIIGGSSLVGLRVFDHFVRRWDALHPRVPEKLG